jgi:hypothetical protein
MEVMSAGSDRQLRWSAGGAARLGFGPAWHDSAYSDAAWFSGSGPFGFGTFANVSPAPAIGTSTATAMQYLTPTLYLRKAFSVTAGQLAGGGNLELVVQYNDGFVAYLNGVEVARRNAWAPHQFVYRDQPAANGTPAHGELNTNPALRSETLHLGAIGGLLSAGENLLAIHALNHWENSTAVNSANTGTSTINNRDNFYFKGDLRIGGTSPVVLVANTSAWKFFPGVAEPAGGVLDPALTFSARRRVPWGQESFLDESWPSGPAPFGAGSAPSGVTLGTPLGAEIVGITPSLYLRVVFTATAADLAETLPLQLLVGFDDGFVAYLNGLEVVRANLGTQNSFVPHTAVATAANGTPQSSVTYTLDPPAVLLNEGQNVLAVQVHNVAMGDADLFLRALLRTNILGSNRQLVGYTATWKYFVGVEEPLPDANEEHEDMPEGPDATPDWVEIHNPGPDPVSLTGWSLSDTPGDPRRWNFPAGASLAAGARLVVVCDGLDVRTPPTNGLYHTNFSLSAAGETVLLTSPGGTSASVPVPALTAFQSFGQNGSGDWRIYEEPSPGAANAGLTYAGRVAAPFFSPGGGLYPTGGTNVTVTITCATPGATIRYTTNGREPDASSPLYTAPLNFTSGTGLRARAFASGLLPSAETAASYILESIANRRNLPALAILGDSERTLYRPFGIFSLVNGSHPTADDRPMEDLWVPGTGSTPLAAINLQAYNIPLYRGRFSERPAVINLYNNGSGQNLNIAAGIRVAASSYSRPRMKFSFQTNADPNALAWTASSIEKGSLNLYFRNDLGGRPLEFPVFPGRPVTTFESLRARAGKNDVSNPFIRDEHARRLFIDLGQVGSRGMINTLYVNGVYKGYYNLTEHLKEGFFQQHFKSTLPWDVIQVTAISSGDNLALQEMVTFLRNHSLSDLANYQALATRLDVVNFADYILLNTFLSTGDWPHNNFVVARERSTSGKFRFAVWDAEGTTGSFSSMPVILNSFSAANANQTSQGVVRSAAPQSEGLGYVIRILYTYLANSPEFRLLFADRIQKHMTGNGALTPSRVLARWEELRSEMAKVGVTVDNNSNVNTPHWVNGKGDNLTWTTQSAANRPSRYRVLFGGYRDGNNGNVLVPGRYVTEGLWPNTRAPSFSVVAGEVSPGTLVSITHTNSSGVIYFTTDGSDPRAPGGTPHGQVYDNPVVLNATQTLKARVLNDMEWSPLQEALYDVGGTPPLLLTEIMYNPPDQATVNGAEYEFLEIKNVGADPVALSGMRIADAFSYTFEAGTVVAPGGFVVLARTPSRFAEMYPGVPVLPTGYGPTGNLANGGEAITLLDAVDQVVFQVSYGDAAPWPAAADAGGFSLVPVDPNANPQPQAAASWRASTRLGGSPGEDDPSPAGQVRIHELLSNPTSGNADWIELHNPSASPADIGGWWLSDSFTNRKKFRIPDGTVIAAGGYLVLTETEFNSGPNPFAFSAQGEQAALSAADALGNLTGYAHQVAFGAIEPGRTFGWHLNSQGREFFVAQTQPSPGAANAGPRVGPVVITELLVAPPPGGVEYVELRNLAAQPVPLYDEGNPSHTWQIDGLSFAFPPAVTLQPRQMALVVPNDPAVFRAQYGVPAPIAIFGPYAGALNNSGERVAVQMPGKPYTNALSQVVVPYIDLDAVAYDDAPPWPEVVGPGLALERWWETAFADDPWVWRAASPGGSPGRPNALDFAAWATNFFSSAELLNPALSGATADIDLDGLANLGEWGMGLDPRAADYTPAVAEWVEDAGQTFLGLRARRNPTAVGLGLHADLGARPGDWSLGTGVLVGSPAPQADGMEVVTFRDTVPLPAATNRVLRLRITAP